MQQRNLQPQPGSHKTPQREIAAAPSEYTFLLQRCIDGATLARAMRLAARWGVPPHRVMITLGWVSENDYVRELAAHWGIPVAAPEEIVFNGWRPSGPAAAGMSAGRGSGRPDDAIVIEAATERPSSVAARISCSPGGWTGCALTGRQSMELAWQWRYRRRMLDQATSSLRRASPEYSAATQLTARQVLRGTSVVGLAIGMVVVAPDVAIRAWTMALTLPFLLVVLVRLIAVGHVVRSMTQANEAPPQADRLADAQLPTYTVLVPLYREANMLPHLLTALQRLDYPAARLDVKIVLEEADPHTLRAAKELELPGHVSLVVVPDGQPRTKPKALNYALQLARGELVAIYDAEDAPEPDQLRAAVEAFRTAAPDVACLQARLNVHNRDAGWLSRQFTLEYCALFDGLLPCLARLGLPLPLGGTSNHFRRSALVASGAWDPYNVTEDADLGLRLHRHGWRTGVIASTTYEEAPERFRDWLPQRTRWLKGWMQTYLVHTKGLVEPQSTIAFVAVSAADACAPSDIPTAASRSSGTRRTRLSMAIGVHVLLGGLLLSILVHPWFFVLAVSEIVSGQFFGRPRSLMGAGFWHIAIGNLALGFTAALALSALTAWRRGYRALAAHVLTMPLYWMLISLAGYRALWQLARDPFRWEKTTHAKHPAAES